MICQRCKSDDTATYYGNLVDGGCGWDQLPEYALKALGNPLAGRLEFSFCLNCGQLSGEWPCLACEPVDDEAEEAR